MIIENTKEMAVAIRKSKAVFARVHGKDSVKEIKVGKQAAIELIKSSTYTDDYGDLVNDFCLVYWPEDNVCVIESM